ncbi:hypothetical protein OCGS_0822 [Oceaniovalibus guishaninsula JLT2003]|uniref:ATP-dependent transcriptional regulator n=1 Tax=Oceaniovalibus guishaninsula JLT2003 TaxID=1231392 RepID=K2HF80_9RHOB|nr:DUF2927 domain-containing protein [Oceaniovalibus guishaninsula]EKE45127.1 hypothetical protein OCGS_0822 [Oceaniovalibus guishaninsula JLT2003]
MRFSDRPAGLLRRLALCLTLALTGCAPAAQPVARLSVPAMALPPMKVFAASRALPPTRANADIAADFLDLSFQLESGRALPVFTRFEGPITLRVLGDAPPGLEPDLGRLLTRLRTEARIAIARVPADRPAAINVEIVPRAELQRAVPQAACFVVPRVASWAEFRSDPRGAATDWTTLTERRRVAIFIPRDVSPQETRDCLHEEIAQSLGPLNDLYRLTDSVFNDDNFHTVLTGFDMLILRATYAPELRSGMDRAAVARALPGIMARINPAGRRVAANPRALTPRAWIAAMERALGPHGSDRSRQAAARRAVRIAENAGWTDNRAGFAQFALGRLSLGRNPDLALASFLRAASLYAASPETRIHEAHVAMQLAAFALAAGQPQGTVAIVDASTDAAIAAQNAALLATLLILKSEALVLLDRPADAAALRREALGWASYGFGPGDEVLLRAAEIASISPRYRKETAA